jgi:hypothetical protein
MEYYLVLKWNGLSSYEDMKKLKHILLREISELEKDYLLYYFNCMILLGEEK